MKKITNLNKTIFLFFYLCVLTSFSQESIKEIKGKVLFEKAPLSGVNIVTKNEVTTTNSKGEYTITASIGEKIQFSYVGFKKVSIIVEDVTEILNINMTPEVTILDESVVKASVKKGKAFERASKSEKEFSSSRGNFNPKKAGYAIGFVDGKEISNTYANIQEALVGKISGYSYDRISGKAYLRGRSMSLTQDYPAAWEIDGVFTNEAPIAIDLDQIESVYALKSLAATNKYGQDGAGGVIVINTKNGNYNQKKKNQNTEQYKNQNYYFNDAITLDNKGLNSNKFTTTLISFNNKKKAFDYYNQLLKDSIKSFNLHLSIADKFKSFYNDIDISNEILDNLAIKYANNSEILKAIAYQFQATNQKQKAIKIYENIFKLRRNYAQSYRDLSNAYLENQQFQKAWRLYMNYLLKGNDINDEGIGQIIYNEMEWLFFVRNNQSRISQKFLPKNENINEFRNDIRVLFEWNTSEAEFDLEFVGPERRSYIFEHSLEKNEPLILDEKTKGYSSKEFYIKDIGVDNWLINLMYYGNKQLNPTFFKVTIYYNWGSSNQRQEITLHELKDLREKIQLFKLNKESILN